MPRELNPSIGQFDRFRIAAIRNCILALVGIGVALSYRAYSDGFGGVTAALLIACACGLGIVLGLQRGASHRWAGASGILVLYAMIVFANTKTGGFHDSNFAWFSAVPIAAALLLGTRAAIGWGAIVVATSFVFWSLGRHGFEFPHLIPEADRAGQDLFNRITQTVALVVLAIAFVRGHDRVSRALVATNDALSHETTRVQLLQFGAIAANEAETVPEAVANCAQRVARVTGWPLAMHWAPDETGHWRFERHWSSVDSDRFDSILAQSRKLRFVSGELALGRVVETAQPTAAVGEEIAADGSPRGVRALDAGLGSVVAVPIVSQGRAVAVLEFWRDDATPLDDATIEILAEVGRQLGRVAHRLQLEERVRHAQKLESVAQLAAGIAHEINNPMAYVRSNLGALAAELGELRSIFEKPASLAEAETRFEDCDELLADAIEGADRTVSIVRDIRNFAHEGREAAAESAELADIAESALRLCGPQLMGPLEVVTSFAPSALVRCNPSQLQQVLVNLIVNGAQSMPNGGRLHIATENHGERVVFAVTDEGEGIESDARERIFDPFFTTKAVGEGTGLGLYVSHGIVEAHSGEIQVEAVQPRGTRFAVSLPAAITHVSTRESRRKDSKPS